MKKISKKHRKNKNAQTDILNDKINAELNKYILLFYFVGVAGYLIIELINAKNQRKI